MSGHGRVDAGGVARSINAVCTCVRSFTIKKLENRQLNVWIKELSFSNWPEDVEKLGALENGQEAHINVPPRCLLKLGKRHWLMTLRPSN